MKTTLLLKNIARKEALTVGEDEVEKEIREIAAQRAQDYGTLKKSLENDDLIENVRSKLLSRKTYELLEEKATITSIRKENSKIPEKGK